MNFWANFVAALDNCPNSCSSNGVCEKTSVNKYQCICNQGWTGRACDVAIEMICNDDIDNDKGEFWLVYYSINEKS